MKKQKSFNYGRTHRMIAITLVMVMVIGVMPAAAADWPVNLNRLNADDSWTNSTISNSTFINLTENEFGSFTDPKARVWNGTTLRKLLGHFDDNDDTTFNSTLAASNYTVKVIGKNKNADRTSIFYSSEITTNTSKFVVADKLNGTYISTAGYPDPKIGTRYYYPLKLHGWGCTDTERSVEEITTFIIDLS
ncbi:hypothetical protein [Methanogenium organophilum]|uniref:Uncharacterized protein n=1 Tax=Methanogenium organophilum TaxID=2199 RepID=A0A9X9T6M7_METOG|nr:hypothetical protein [Methanogenium organophilum]WAI00518.1 hypothetical protein OU421_08760 [Methanogenium organophilum]